MRIRVLATVAAVASLGLGAGGAAAAPSQAAHTYSAPAQSGQTVRMHVGDKLRVQLRSSYDPPTSSRPDRLRRVRYSGGYPTGQPLTAVFKALRTGRAEVSAQTDYPCLHTTPRCEIAQQMYVVHVVIR